MKNEEKARVSSSGFDNQKTHTDRVLTGFDVFYNNTKPDKKVKILLETVILDRETELCSFCRRNLADGAIRFRGIRACARCFKLAQSLICSLQSYDLGVSS